MAQTLREAFDDLASDVPPPGESGDLWKRGVRRHRLRQMGAALAVVAIAGGVAGAWAGMERRDLPVSTMPTPRPAIPDQLFDVPRFTKGTAELGPPGQVAAVLQARDRGWTDGKDGFVAVSATNGSYRFLDLPGLDQSDPWVLLSPDGNAVAYPLRGKPKAKAYSRVVGVGVYDAITGKVHRKRFDTEHGLRLDEGDVVWSPDSQVLLLEPGQMFGEGSSRGQDPLTWVVATGRTRALPDRALDLGGADPSGIVRFEDTRAVTLDPRTGEMIRVLEVQTEQEFWNGPIYGPQEQVAWIGDAPFDMDRARGTGGDPGALYVATVAPGVVVGRSVPAKHVLRLYGWLNDHEVLAQSLSDSPEGGFELYRVDVDSGARTIAIECGCQPQLATDLLDQPFRKGVAPQSYDPRSLVIGLGVAGILSVGYGFVWLWRRRRLWR